MSGSIIRTEKINVVPGALPEDYHCRCDYCRQYIGELIRADGTHYNRNDRRRYYSPAEVSNSREGEKGGHVAKTPLHIARWAVQTYTKKGDWVLDPTIGAGTTAVEALNHGRCVAGMEIEFIDVIRANVALNNPDRMRFKIWHGDARSIGKCLKDFGEKFALLYSSPPYAGDESQKGRGSREAFEYDRTMPNIAFVKEGKPYFDTMGAIYRDCAAFLKKGGRIVIGVKDQMRKKEPDMLHRRLVDCVLEHCPGVEFEGTALLRHYPTTLHLNTYFRHHGVHCPYHQSIMVLRKTK